jgi:23S rRNA pseudouridine1911/1915/1917 synthase
MKKMDIQIIYEDDDIVAVNKPAGLVVHSDGRTDEPTISDWVLENYPQTKNVGESIKLTSGAEIQKHGIVHRLDRDTTGVLLIAKNQETFLFIKKQFQKREIKKTYRAIVYGTFRKGGGIIDKPIGREKKDFRRWTTGNGARGTLREAITEYEILYGSKEFTYLEVRPKTGRTHQIRVHMKAIYHPIVCDRLYAPKRTSALGMDRLALHALSIEFMLQSGEKIKIKAPLPDDIKEAICQMDC